MMWSTVLLLLVCIVCAVGDTTTPDEGDAGKEVNNRTFTVGDISIPDEGKAEEEVNKTTCPKERTCLKKCCQEGEVLSNNLCEKNSNKTRLLNEAFQYEDRFYILYENPCSEEDPFYLDKPHYIIKDDGSLFDITDHSTYYIFCVDDNTGRAVFCDEYIDPLDGDNAEKNGISQTAILLYVTGFIISLPFLVSTFFVYAIIAQLRNLHGKCLMCLVTSFFVTFFLDVLVFYLDDGKSLFCRAAAFIIYFSFLASFFWLNVMCLDIWWTFSGFRPLRGSVKEREHKKFIIYSLYSWGCPLIMLVVAMVMDLYPGISDDYIKPKFGDQKCWFDDNTSALYYFVGPIAFLLVCNIALFIFTAIRIRQLKNETKILQRKDSKRHDDEDNNRQRFNLYLKLFLVMGVNWIMEIISWFAGGPEYLWYVTDIGNTLQGVLIFIIFVWKDRVRRLLMERFCPKRAMSGTAKSVVTSTRSITRSSPSRNNTLNARPQTQERNSNHEDYRMKPLMETSCTDVP